MRKKETGREKKKWKDEELEGVARISVVIVLVEVMVAFLSRAITVLFSRSAVPPLAHTRC